MEHAVVDKAYMAQLVEVQQMRGATGGVEFHKLLTKDLETPPEKENGEALTYIVLSPSVLPSESLHQSWQLTRILKKVLR